MSLLDDTLCIDPLYFIESHRTIKGEKFKIQNTGREYLIDLYRYACIGSIAEGRSMVVVKGRQVEMTETALNISLYFLKNYSNFTVLHAFPRAEQASRYSKDRLQQAIRTSQKNAKGEPKLESLKSHLKGTSDTVSSINFANENNYYIQSAWGNGDALRGIPCDLLSRDEFQDWTDDAIANTSQCLAASKYKIDFAFGTPKQSGSKYENLWLSSDQRFYHLKCPGCSHYFRITLENFKTGFMVECPKCKKLSDKRVIMKDGKWIPSRSGASRVGFHVSQLLSPRITREEIARTQADSSDAKFKNEVLGEFYSGAGQPLVESEVINRCAEPYRNIDFSPSIQMPNQTFMGLDWGGRNDQKDKGAYTVVTIISKDQKFGNYKLEYTERLTNPDMESQVRYVSDLIRLYNSTSVVADWGFGQFQVQKLQKSWQSRVKSCFYSTNIKNKLKYDTDTWMLTIDRNAFLEDVIEIVKRGNLQIPWRTPTRVDWFIKQICNTELRYSERTNNISRSYEKLDKYYPNDSLHSLNYAYVASVIQLGEGGLGPSVGTQAMNLGLPKPIVTSFNGKVTRPGSPTNSPMLPNLFRH